jgi:flagellar biogenesis protein FliO
VKWTTAAIAGGGAAGVTQSVTSLLRAKSTVMTGGLGNAAVSTSEAGGALLVSLLALLAPLAALALVVAFCWLGVRFMRRVLRRTEAEPTHE